MRKAMNEASYIFVGCGLTFNFSQLSAEEETSVWWRTGDSEDRLSFGFSGRKMSSKKF